ncbi:hypothetical protein, variant [Verruconis gallopava]|uniref:VOC domain-containing protein n=1 Tax=Verruconis gallopava TaxID=253628 RepID=A0A0D2AL97_9PEZI|nr:uncharacterized protein PV09_01481 [Verruconis gallopava]XP_016217387.1 hypothetical protein, variant [Verruconis gallopava]KIW07517.1 hypothetical protein PV09_01481 [Verruconis gallopava]KIW07518.1 hypothetical protein, variant [Verruconis gallopava]
MASPERKIMLKRIAHIYYIHEDLEKVDQFLHDFGFTTTRKDEDKIYYKGYGTEPFVYCLIKGPKKQFGGAAFAVESLEDLELASRTLPDATPIHDLDAPGGGKRVSFKDPVDGFPFHLVYGQTPIEAAEEPPVLQYNHAATKPRPVNHVQRFKHAPAAVHKLGHFGCCVTDFQKTYEFYTTYFNFKASDLIFDPQTGKDITAFMHLDRGTEQVDHHCFFFFEGPEFHVHHSSYEVHDFDVQGLGHQWLRDKGYESVWGIGRHVLGSQIFDYWWDPSRFMMEHYTDGDLVDETTKTGREPAGPDGLHIWGPPLPPTFLQ